MITKETDWNIVWEQHTRESKPKGRRQEDADKGTLKSTMEKIKSMEKSTTLKTILSIEFMTRLGWKNHDGFSLKNGSKKIYES